MSSRVSRISNIVSYGGTNATAFLPRGFFHKHLNNKALV
jgi:hypothetical protein